MGGDREIRKELNSIEYYIVIALIGQEHKMEEQDYLWNKYDVKTIKVNDDLKDIGIVGKVSLNFYFDKGRVSLYSDNAKWVFAIFGNDNNLIVFTPFRGQLNMVTKKRDEQLRSMMNTHGISNRNAPTMLAQMAIKMQEHSSELIDPKDDPFGDVPFFKYAKNPRWINIMNNMHDIQYFVDDAPYVIDAAAFFGVKIPDSNPLFTMDIAPPASGKSEWLKMMTPGMRSNKYTHPLSDLTSKSLISGLEGNEDMYPQFDNKLVVMEEFTNLITKDPTERASIMGQIRTMYGGNLSKSFGSGVGTKSYKANVGMLIGCTPMIDRIAAEMAIAGDKWIKVRRHFELGDSTYEKIADAAYEDVIRDPALIEAVQDELFSLYEDFDPEKMPEIPVNMEPYIKNCAHITGILRVSVDRDNYSKGKDVTSEPVIEAPGRLVKVYKKLARIIAWMLEKPEVDAEVISYIYRVALDTPTANRISILRKMGFIKNEKSLAVLADEVRLAKNTVKIIIEDLKVADVVMEGSMEIAKGHDDEKISIDTFYLNVNSKLFQYISNTELLLGTLPPEQVHHNGMSESGVDMWKEANYQPITIDVFDYTAHGEEGEHDEPDHTFVPDTSHLTVHDDDPDWNQEPEHEPVEEAKTPFVKPHDPNEEVEDEEHNDPNMEE